MSGRRIVALFALVVLACCTFSEGEVDGPPADADRDVGDTTDGGDGAPEPADAGIDFCDREQAKLALDQGILPAPSSSCDCRGNWYSFQTEECNSNIVGCVLLGWEIDLGCGPQDAG
jgi:hypothetical protein